MKQITFIFILSLLLNVTYLSANEVNPENSLNKNERIENTKDGAKDLKMQKKEKRLLKKYFKKEAKKDKYKHLKEAKVNALVIIGFLIFLPGLILSLLGTALIPALVLLIVGGTLWIIGLLKMKNG